MNVTVHFIDVPNFKPHLASVVAAIAFVISEADGLGHSVSQKRYRHDYIFR